MKKFDFPFTVATHAQPFALLDGPLGKALLATYDPATQKLFASEVERVQRLK
jgi:hypothetical protein